MAATYSISSQNGSNAPRKRANLKAIPKREQLKFTEKYTKELFDQYRRTGDQLADKCCQELQTKHGGLVNIHDLLGTVKEKALLPGPDGQPFRDFLKDAEIPPSWVTPEIERQIYRGQEVQAMFTPFMGIALFSGSLLGGSMFRNAAVVTALAGNISSDPTRRIKETSILIASLGLPGSLFRPGQIAHDSMTRVRLLHGALRAWLPTTSRLQAHRPNVPARVYIEGEVPINQLDLAITLGTFCYFNLRSLRRMSVILHEKDVQAYTTMWRYAGKLLGIDDFLCPKSIEDQEEFMFAAIKHQGAPEAIDSAPTLEFMEAFAKEANKETFGLFGAEFFNSYLQQMTRYLNGNDFVAGMKIEDKGDYHWSVVLTRMWGYFFGTIPSNLPYGEKVMIWAHMRKINEMIAERGTATGHGAGTGEDITKKMKSKL